MPKETQNTRMASGSKLTSSRSSQHHKTVKVFIPRDYSQGTVLRFAAATPPQLRSHIPEDVFEAVIGNINQILGAAEKGSASIYLESCFACLTGYLVYLCMETKYEKSLKAVRYLVDEYNSTVFGPRNLLMIDPSERGLRVIEIVVLRP